MNPKVVHRERESAPSVDVHTEACDGLRCPCYMQGQLDLAEAIKVMQRMGLPIDDVLNAGCKDSRPLVSPPPPVSPEISQSTARRIWRQGKGQRGRRRVF